MNQITLKDGTEVPLVLYLPIKKNLDKVAEKHNEAFQELVLNCRNSAYVLLSYQKSFKILREWELIETDGKVHDVVKSIVLNSSEGIVPAIKLVDPKKKV